MGEGEVRLADRVEKFGWELRELAQGVAKLTVDAASDFVKEVGLAATAMSMLVRNPKVAAAAAGIAAGGASLGLSEESKGALIPAGADPTPYRQYGSTFTASNGGSLVWVQGNYQGTNFYWSGIRIDATHIATSAHPFVGSNGQQVLSIQQVGTGDNIFSNPGITSPVSSVTVYPGYMNDGNFNTPDIAIITLASAIPGANAVFAPATSTNVGTVLHLAGFGRLEYPGSGPVGAYSGDAMGFNAPVISGVPSNVSDEYYFAVRFGGTASLLSLNGMGSQFDSGGITLNDFSQIVGEITAGTPGYPSGGASIVSDWTTSPYQTFIASNIPAPGTALLVGAGIAGLMMRRRENA